ncbi:MAG: hypothetical protein M3N32_04000 [Actinomycetota bacterium]|nr:hypothetical protein [Actinomycetota bacterium]
MVAVVAADDSDDAVRILTSRGVQAWAMGSVCEGSGVEIVAAG